MDTEHQQLTDAEREIVSDRFHLELGRCISTWSVIEISLCELFARMAKLNRDIARSIFFSPSGFDGRRRLLKAIMENSKSIEGVDDYLEAIVSKSKSYAESRNLILHGDCLFIIYKESKYFEKQIVFSGRKKWVTDPPDQDVITVENLEMATGNFSILAQCILLALNWDGANQVKSPLKFLELVRQLPSPAHRSKLDPKIAAQFPIDSKDIFFRWH